MKLFSSWNNLYQCGCGQWWWRYNTYHNLWSPVNDSATLDNIKKGCKKPVAINVGKNGASTNLSNLVDNGYSGHLFSKR